MNEPEAVDRWRAQYTDWRAEANDPAFVAMAEWLARIDLEHDLNQGRTADISFFAWIVTPLEQRAMRAPFVAHLLLWLYGIDSVLDSCTDIETAYDLHTVAVFAATHPHIALSDAVLAGLPLHTDIAIIIPDATCSILSLGHSAQQLVLNAANAYPDNADNLALFNQEFDKEVWAEVTESEWRLGGWQGRNLAEYVAVGGASIAALVTTAAILFALPEMATAWEQLRPAIWQVAVVCRLVNDVATVERDRAEGRANALFVADVDEGLAHTKVSGMIAAALQRLSVELMALPASPLTEQLGFALTRMVDLTLMMYHAGDFQVPTP